MQAPVSPSLIPSSLSSRSLQDKLRFLRKGLPLLLKIPRTWLRYRRPLAHLLNGSPFFRLRRCDLDAALASFAFRNDEEEFTLMLMSKRPNLWVFRTNQQGFCGDFLVVDMAAPSPLDRKIYALDLKQGAALKFGGGGAGDQFTRLQAALDELSFCHEIVPPTAACERISGDSRLILAFFHAAPL